MKKNSPTGDQSGKPLNYKVAAKNAFSSPTALAARLSPTSRVPFVAKSDSSVAHSRRSQFAPSLRDPEDAMLFEQMAVVTGVTVRTKSPPKKRTPAFSMSSSIKKQLATNEATSAKAALSMADKAIATATGFVVETKGAAQTGTPISTTQPPPQEQQGKVWTLPLDHAPEASVGSSKNSHRRDLDLKHNDNSFHVLANLVVGQFYSKRHDGSDAYTLTEDDRASLDSVLPPSVRQSFVEAVRFRLQQNCPPDSDSHIHVITRKCQELGLDREGEENPLMAAPAKRTITITNLPPLGGRPRAKTDLTSPSVTASANVVKQVPSFANASAVSSITYTHPKVPTPRDEQSVAGSTLTAPSRAGSLSEAHVSTTESLARQQLMAELRDASKFMADSRTPETAKFWRDHVIKLQARLRALHGDTPTDARTHASTGSSSDVTPDEILEANRKLLAEYEPAAYKPPPLSFSAPPSPYAGAKSSPYTAASPSPYTAAPPSPYTAAPPSPYSAPPPAETYKRQVTPPSYHRPPPVRTVTTTRQDRSVSPEPGRRGEMPMVDVVAPADLPGGYNFEAEIDGRRFIATVPVGGVDKGETFSCLMRDLNSGPGADIPIGGWRDRLCDCGVYGFCHAVFLNTLCCPLLSLGQIMTRVHFDFLGQPSRKSRSSYGVMLGIVIMWITMNALIFAAYNYKWSRMMELTIADMSALVFLNITMLVYAIYATSATRASLREKYMIRENRCYDLEDCCCATFCMPCTICQMARHTADFDEDDADCCSPTGLFKEPRKAPARRNSHMMVHHQDMYML